ncbi:hypothetical protein D0817_22220 [Flavobacterium cupreum]|uniref:Uncharacterized protein n=1 Tax=Flavobacterium cupreum TaxID=2133766 RepID=A0A434A1P6_9FLAO|nr:hypothetical protein [Flavobacterium cupreum]RUT68247.1 hypothetical protein D0817_22220 [Flavobacterium cupreum]
MLGIFCMYWVWKAFSNLAIEYRKSKWKYFFLGLGSYYAAVVVSVSIVVGLMLLAKGFVGIADPDFGSAEWNLFYLLSGASGCYGCYVFLAHKARKEKELLNKNEIEYIGIISDEI